MADWISRNNGKLFIYLTHDAWANFGTFITKTEESVVFQDGAGNDITRDQFTYLTQKSGKYTTVGVQKNVDFSDLIVYAIGVTQPDIIDNNYRRKNYHAMTQTGFYRAEGQDVGMLKEQVLRISGLGSYEDAKKKDIVPTDRAGKLVTGLLNAAQQVPEAFEIIKDGLINEIKVSDEVPWTDAKGKKFKFKTLLEIASPTTGKSYIFNYVKKGNEFVWSVSRFDGYNKRIIDQDTQMLSIKDITVPIDDLVAWVRTTEGLQQNNLYDPRDIQLRLISRKGTATETPSYAYYPTYTRNVIYALTNKLPNYKMLDGVLRNDPYFKNEIFINDVAGAAISENTLLRTLATSKIGYTTDAVNIEGPIFTIDRTQIIKGTREKMKEKSLEFQKFQDDVSKLTSILSEHKFAYPMPEFKYKAKTDYAAQFKQLIDEVNSYLKSAVIDPNVAEVVLNDGELSIVYTEDYDQLVTNLLTNNDINFESLAGINFENRNFITTFVTKSDGSQVGYSISKDKGNWELSEFASIESYTNVMNALSGLSGLGLNPISISKIESYIRSIQSDSTSMTLARDYVAVIADNAGVLTEFNTIVNNYLLERLKNNEC